MSYDPRRAAVTRAAVLATLAKQVRDADVATRADVLALLQPGERLNGQLPDGSLAGRVRVDPGPSVPYVEDEAKLLAHVAEAHPSEVETVRRVRPAYVARLLAAVKDTGELPPGIGVRDGDPRVVVTVSAPDRAAVAKAWADGTLSVADLVQPALPPGGGA